MRRPRLKNDGESYYHLYTRMAFQRQILGDLEKNVLVAMMRKLALFCGLDILTYCVMDNHFHILVHVPERGDISTDELLVRYGYLYGSDKAKELRERWEDLMKNPGTAYYAEAEMAALRRRMGDISTFMQALKHRFSIWYRHHHDDYKGGTIWDSRFGSTLIEGSNNALSAVAAYIDLNSVRGGIVDDPAEYAWSGYGSAMAGNKDSRKGLAMIYHPYCENDKEVYFTKKIAENYRQLLYIEGADVIPTEDIEKTIASGGALPLAVMLRVYVRYFTRSMALGSEDFIEDVFREHRDLFGIKRKSGARRFKGCSAWPDGAALCSARDLLLRTVPRTTAEILS